ncbi:MAG: hypothetical protein IIB22_11705 [Chloroflexi bacterium]|nr:hypothetical protein [Chloroflexota bacterium]
MEWGSLIWLLLAIVGAASIAGGVVAHRRGASVGAQAFGAAAVAAGVAMWAIVLVTVPVSSSGDAPAPVIVVDEIAAE